MISLDENTIAVWMIGIPPSRDFFCALIREGGVFKVVGRLRTYHPGSKNPFDGRDKKEWISKELKQEQTVDAALKAARSAVNQIGELYNRPVEEVRASSSEEWIRALQAKKWIHMQAAPVEGGPNEN